MSISEKRCFACGETKPAGDFGRLKSSRDGLYSYCRICSGAKNREIYRRKQAAGSCARHVPKELLPPMPNTELTCLRCRHCELMPDTDFTSASPMVWCNKQQARHIVILSGCGIADPRPQRPRGLHKYWVRYGPLGDLVKAATPVLLAYLKARWQTMPAEKLELHTGRTMNDLRQIVRAHGIGGAGIGAHRLHNIARPPGKVFTRSQGAWLLKEYGTDRWPKPCIWNMRPDELARRQADKERVIEHLATLGPRWNWEQITRYINKQQNNANRRRRNPQPTRRINQHLEIAITE